MRMVCCGIYHTLVYCRDGIGFGHAMMERVMGQSNGIGENFM